MRELHPACAFALLFLLLLLSVFSQLPIVILLSLVGSVSFCALTGGARGQIKLACALIFLFALTNPLFSHEGDTVLFYLNHNAVTVESIVYGAKIGGMMAGTLCWFSAFARILDSERLLYLFGRVLPKTGLLLCAGERMLPLIKRCYAATAEAQRLSSVYEDGLLGKLKFHARVLSVTMAVTLEQSVQNGQSMKARGYGLGGRTVYGRFCFYPSDGLFLAVSIALACLSAVAILTENMYLIVCFGALCALPALREGREKLRWRS